MPEKSKASMLDEDIEKPKNGLELQEERERLRRRRLLSFDETGNIFYSIVCVVLLVVEYGLWIQVVLIRWGEWQSSSPSFFLHILIPIILPSLFLPLLYLLHSLTNAKFRWRESLLLLCPATPILLHLLLIVRRCQGHVVTRLDHAGRVAGMVQVTLMSGPLILVSLVTAMKATVLIEDEKVDIGEMDKHFYDYGIQALAASVSLVEILVSSIRYNERTASNGVKLMVAVPFIFTTLCFRLIGLAVLFTFFQQAWAVLALCLLFCINGIGVQLSTGSVLCRKLYNSWFSDVDDHPHVEGGPSLAGCILLSIASIFVPSGYNQDRRLGHTHGRGWKLVVVSWLGGVVLLATVISHALSNYIPNTYTTLQNLDMTMVIPRTGVALDIHEVLGGLELKAVQPKLTVNIEADNPIEAEVKISPMLDRLLAVVIPTVLAVIIAPFAVLRVLLLGWDCRLIRHEDDRDDDTTSSSQTFTRTRYQQSAGRLRSCGVVFCSLSALLMFVTVVIVMVAVYVYIIIKTSVEPLVVLDN